MHRHGRLCLPAQPESQVESHLSGFYLTYCSREVVKFDIIEEANLFLVLTDLSCEIQNVDMVQIKLWSVSCQISKMVDMANWGRGDLAVASNENQSVQYERHSRKSALHWDDMNLHPQSINDHKMVCWAWDKPMQQSTRLIWHQQSSTYRQDWKQKMSQIPNRFFLWHTMPAVLDMDSNFAFAPFGLLLSVGLHWQGRLESHWYWMTNGNWLYFKEQDVL